MPDAPSPVPVLVIGGYLGSGKTTLVNHLLRSTSERLMVLVNDFGQSVIDAALVEATDGDVLQLAGGCVCCQIGDDLAGALQRAVDQRPDRLVIETSGVAQPAAVATSVAMFPGLAMDAVVVLADAERIRQSLADRYVGDLVTAQLRQADVVLLNRTDLVADPADALAAVGAVARGPVIPCMNGEVPPEVLTSVGHEASVEAALHDAGDLFWSRTLPAAGSPAEVMARLAAIPGLVRAKGFVQSPSGEWRLLQVVGARVTSTPWSGPTPPAAEVVVIALRPLQPS